jgi:spore germination cell wall hydrolase CwlJ-like protein
MSKCILIIAYLLYGEARGEGKLGINNVASVLMNSSRDNGLDRAFNLVYEAMKPGRYDTMKGLTADMIDIPRQNGRKDEQAWEYCVEVATEMCHGNFEPVNNSTHFFNPDKCNPSWKGKLQDTFMVGRHFFGRL